MKTARNLSFRLSERLWVRFMCRRSLQSFVSSIRFSGFIVVLMLILVPSMGFMEEVKQNPKLAEELEESEVNRNPVSLVDVPDWRIGDRWYYSGFLDVRDFVADSGVATNVETLNGNLDTQVTDIYTTTVEGVSTLVYKVESEGEYEAQNVELAGYDGDLIIEIDTVEIIRASDLASIEQEATIDIDFDYQIWFWTYTIHVAELVVTNEYDPALEGYDFPISVGEYWETSYSQDTTYSGSSDYVDIPSDTSTSNTTSWEVVSRGSSGVTYSGCAQSYNITTRNSNGDDTGYKWYCPAISNDIKSSTTESIGFIATHELSWYQKSTRINEIDVDVEFQLSPLDMQIDATVTVTDNTGNAVSNQNVEFRFEIDGDIRTFTTDSYGQFIVNFNTGNSPDQSDGGSEHGSHGVITWIDGNFPQVGTTTVIIDQNVHPVDLIANAAGVTVERTRGDRTVSLNPAIGFNAVPGDVLTFSVPVVNRGILASPETDLRVTGPDGVSSTSYVPALGSLEEQRVELDWEVPAGQPIGNSLLEFIVDESEAITNDGNRSNNLGLFSLYIGRLPVAELSINSPLQTYETATLDAMNSIDPDGGIVECLFEIESTSGNMEIIEDDDCIHDFVWEDDGEYMVRLTITDGESDTDTIEETFTILNRPPEIIVEASAYSVPVLSSVTFEVTHREDMDTNNPISPVDISWQTACEEGSTVSARCTVTPTQEGNYTIEVIALDDDGATVTEELTVEVTNIAPSELEAEIWLSSTRLTPDSRGVYTINEGDLIEIRGSAVDSPNDIEDLFHLWSPDAEHHPEIKLESIGQNSIIEHTYTTSGLHLATLEVTDDDGASSETLVVAIEVVNIAPKIDPISTPLPAPEDGEITITASVWDTVGDIETLVNCFDLNPEENSDEIGDSTDDCDFEGNRFIGSWPDAQQAPSTIIFHTTDDDGETASVEIPISVNNVKPDAYAMVSNQNPTIGDFVVLSANLTTDSSYDLETLRYVWDLDVTTDSDGNGNPSDDEDYVGQWFAWETDTSGTISVKLTVTDEELSDSMLITLNIEEAPFSFGDLVSSPIVIIVIILILAGGGGFAYVQMRKPDDLIQAPAEVKRGRKVSMDDAFDDPEFDPFSQDKSKRRVQQQKRSDEGELVESKEKTEPKVPESIVSEEAPVIQMSELDEEYEQARSSEVVNDEVFNDLLGDSESSNEEE